MYILHEILILIFIIQIKLFSGTILSIHSYYTSLSILIRYVNKIMCRFAIQAIKLILIQIWNYLRYTFICLFDHLRGDFWHTRDRTSTSNSSFHEIDLKREATWKL